MPRREDILIKGGSVEVDFDPEVYRRPRGDRHKFCCSDRKIVGVEIRDENHKIVTRVPKNGRCTIRIRIKQVKVETASRQEPASRKKTTTTARAAPSKKK